MANSTKELLSYVCLKPCLFDCIFSSSFPSKWFPTRGLFSCSQPPKLLTRHSWAHFSLLPNLLQTQCNFLLQFKYPLLFKTSGSFPCLEAPSSSLTHPSTLYSNLQELPRLWSWYHFSLWRIKGPPLCSNGTLLLCWWYQSLSSLALCLHTWSLWGGPATLSSVLSPPLPQRSSPIFAIAGAQ